MGDAFDQISPDSSPTQVSGGDVFDRIAPDKSAKGASLPGSTIPENYGFTPGHMLSNAYEGAKSVAAGSYSLAKDLINNPNWVSGPNSTMSKFVDQPAAQQVQKASQDFQSGNKVSGYGHILASAIPILGPAAASLGEQAGTGDVGGALAKGAGQAIAPKIAGKAIDVAPYLKPVAGGLVRGYLKKAIPHEAVAAYKAVKGAGPEPVNPGAPLPAAPTPELQQAGALRTGATVPPESPAAALARLRTVPSQPSAAAGPAALTKAISVWRDATRQNVPYAGEVEASPAPSGNAPQATPQGSTPSLADANQLAQSQSVPVGKTPQLKGDPYNGPRSPVMETLNDSSTIAKTGYHPESQTAVMEFKNGKVYEYRGVPPAVYDNFKNAESRGSFHAQNIKGRYETNYLGASKPMSAGAKAKQALMNQSGALAGQP